MIVRKFVIAVCGSVALIAAAQSARADECNGTSMQGSERFARVNCQADGTAIGYRTTKLGNLIEARWSAEGTMVSAHRVNPRNVPLEARSNFSKVCPRTSGLGGLLIYKSIASPHIRGDARATSTSWIGKFGAPGGGGSCVSGIGTDGTTYHRFGYYGTWVGGPWRYYGGYSCGTRENARSLASKLTRGTKSRTMYVKHGSTCYQVPDVLKCYNSAGC